MNFLTDILLLLLGLAAAWWLSSYDVKLSGDNSANDILRRGIRCGVTLTLLIILTLLPYSIVSAPFVFLMGGLLAIVWAGCLTELFSQGFRHLIGFAGTDREFDPHESTRDVNRLAELIRAGRHQEAAQFFEKCKSSAGGHVVAMETLLDRAGIQREQFQRANSLRDAAQFQREGRFSEAEAILKSLLEKNPAHVDAAMMLMRLYVRDLRQSGKAAEILTALKQQPHISAAAIEYAQRSIHDWGRKKIEPKVEPLPESVEELLQAGYYGTAIEMLEQKVKEQPRNFDAQLKLAEAYVRSGDLPPEISGKGAAIPAAGTSGETATTDAAAIARQLFQWARRDPKLKVIPAVERELVIQALKETNDNQVAAAKLLGITRATLRKRIEKFKIQRELNVK